LTQQNTGSSGVDFSIDDIERVSRNTPLLADLKPGGGFTAVDLHRAGGVGLILRRLLDAGLLHGDAATVTGAALPDGDMITLDVAPCTVDVELTDSTIAARLEAWTAPPPRYESGVMAKYARLAGSAAAGAVTSAG
jgi:dihydroxyacid dehydratase/phosphogluconate dehydratase